MDIIDVNLSNAETEHICCAITDKKGESCVCSKKAWLRERFEDGLVFKKLNARGKVFIEYIPAEYAWCPIEADDYMYIDCFWVSGQFKGQGYGARLLDECIKDAKAKGKCGLAVLSSPKKMPFLSDPVFLKRKGFKVADTALPFFELLYLPLKEGAVPPRFKECCKYGKTNEKGVVLYYSNQCPFTSKYAPLLQHAADEKGISFKLVRVMSTEQAQDAPTPFTTYSLFINGSFVTNEILTDEKFKRLLENADYAVSSGAGGSTQD
jgi:GNAT superfamily N-acetyltransferase